MISVFFLAAPDGSPVVEMPNPDIPASVILELHHLQATGLSLEDAVTNIRGNLVPLDLIPSAPTQMNHSLTSYDQS